MNTRTAKLLLAILILFLMLTVINVVVHIFKNDYVTETAVAVSASNAVSFKGVYIRDEQTIRYDRNGVISYAVDDGGRLSAGEIAAYVYNDEKQIRINERIAAIDAEIAVLNKIQNPGTQEVDQPAYLAGLIENAYKNIISYKEAGDLEKLRSEKEELVIYLSTMQYVTQEVMNFSDKIASLNTERHNLESQQVDPIDTIPVPNSSYFVSYTDGYEEILNFNKADTLTAAEIKSVTDLNTEKIKPDSIGKIINGYTWKIAGIIEDPRDYFREGKNIKLYFPSSGNTIDAVIEKIRPAETDNANEKIVLIDCTDMSYDFVQHRVETIEIQDEEYKGIRIPREAIFVKEMEIEKFNSETQTTETVETGVRGVYIKQGENVIFKWVDEIFQDEDYIVSRMRPESNYVQLYDDTIVSGLSVGGMVE
ncbi:HlyD family efflux transporter periplasmic adaptor subunit [Ruminococcus sp. HUN007]|uniref:HlyD family efflux transporter periplasmic adaptor subunit n=1 Tax=Ruminococcus sp. HUN007 TaxID=1514668 RepID=UPI0005D29BE1|nr:HlyD family efflux transporter periplasmic adaptor subunit [Ruminococcus sp. HUN007]